VVVKGRSRGGHAGSSDASPPRRIRVGGNVQATKLILMPDRSTPRTFSNSHSGAVVMRAVISINGDLLNVEAVSSDVDARLVTAALDAVRIWKYQPTLLTGSRGGGDTITVDFQLGSKLRYRGIPLCH